VTRGFLSKMDKLNKVESRASQSPKRKTTFKKRLRKKPKGILHHKRKKKLRIL